jgi:sugar lactone lactonase YvrE
MDLQVIKNYKSTLGEGALWNHITNELFWIDIEGKKFMIYNPEKNENRIFQFEKKTGTVVPEDNDHVIIALEDGIYRYNINSATLKLIYKNHNGLTRFNDGKCDPAGRFWVGTMDKDGKKPLGRLYRFDNDDSIHTMKDNVIISNGIAWSLDHKKMYYIDTATRKIVEYVYDNLTGEIFGPKDAIIIPPGMGMPDGCTLDEEGMLWIALWDGSSIGRWDPETGELLSKVDVPALNVTSVAFGDKNLDTLYITTADISDNERPLAGYLFSFKPGVKGIKVNFYRNGNI